MATLKITHTDMVEVSVEERVETKTPSTVILYDPRKVMVTFTCSHCGARFKTLNWNRTSGKHYSASCPCCSYRAWAR